MFVIEIIKLNKSDVERYVHSVVRPTQKPTFNYVYAIHKNILFNSHSNILFNSHSIYMSFQNFLYFGQVALYMLNKLFEFEFVVVYQKYLTRLEEMIIFSPRLEHYQFFQPR